LHLIITNLIIEPSTVLVIPIVNIRVTEKIIIIVIVIGVVHDAISVNSSIIHPILLAWIVKQIGNNTRLISIHTPSLVIFFLFL